MQEYTITFFEACEALSRSRKSVSRYVRQGLLHPKEIKSAQGTLEYRFSRADLDLFKNQEKVVETEQDEVTPEKIKLQQGMPPQPEARQDNSIVPFLLEQLKVKDSQIKTMGEQMTQMIERDRETNILIHSFQQKLGAGEVLQDEK